MDVTFKIRSEILSVLVFTHFLNEVEDRVLHMLHACEWIIYLFSDQITSFEHIYCETV